MGAVLLVTMLTLGGLGLYLALPGGRLQAGRSVLIVFAGAAAAMLALLLPRMAGERAEIWFAALALLAAWGAIRVITHSRPVYSALYFILVAIAVAGMLVLMQAEFLAAALLIIYAGAILVTYVFVIMLAQQAGGPAEYDRSAREPFLGVLSGLVLLTIVSARLLPSDGGGVALPVAMTADSYGSVLNVGTQLLTDYVIAVQLAALLLLAAMVGAIAIARRKAEPGHFEEAD